MPHLTQSYSNGHSTNGVEVGLNQVLYGWKTSSSVHFLKGDVFLQFLNLEATHKVHQSSGVSMAAWIRNTTSEQGNWFQKSFFDLSKLPFYARILICTIEILIITPISPPLLSANAATFKVFLNQICKRRIMKRRQGAPIMVMLPIIFWKSRSSR